MCCMQLKCIRPKGFSHLPPLPNQPSAFASACFAGDPETVRAFLEHGVTAGAWGGRALREAATQ